MVTVDTKYRNARNTLVFMDGSKAAEWPNPQAHPEQRGDGYLWGDIWGLETGRPGVSVPKLWLCFCPRMFRNGETKRYGGKPLMVVHACKY